MFKRYQCQVVCELFFFYGGLFCDDPALIFQRHQVTKLTQENLGRKNYTLSMRLQGQVVQELLTYILCSQSRLPLRWETNETCYGGQ